MLGRSRRETKVWREKEFAGPKIEKYPKVDLLQAKAHRAAKFHMLQRDKAMNTEHAKHNSLRRFPPGTRSDVKSQPDRTETSHRKPTNDPSTAGAGMQATHVPFPNDMQCKRCT